MKTDIIMFAACSIVILILYICAFRWEKTICSKKPLQLIGSLVAVAIEGCAIWRGIRYNPPYLEAQVLSDPGLLWLMWLALAVATAICLFWYLMVFANIITLVKVK